MEDIKNNSTRNFSPECKPIKLILEIIMNRKNIMHNASNLSNFNISKNSDDLLDISLNDSKFSTRDKKIKIKINLDVSNSDENETIPQSNAFKKNADEEKLPEENFKFESTNNFSKLESSNNLTILSDADIENLHNHSFWHKIFEKVQTNYKNSLEDKKIVEIIHGLIMEKYKQALIHLKQRIKNRHNKSNITNLNESTDELEHKENINIEIDRDFYTEPMKYEKKFNSMDNFSVYSSASSNKILNKGVSNNVLAFQQDAREECKVKNNILESDMSLPQSLREDIVEYDSRKFLRAALGDEHQFSSFNSESDFHTCYYDSPTLDTPNTFTTEQSIGSSNISMLISEVYPGKSMYSTVNKNVKSKSKSRAKVSAKSTKSSNDYGYESLDDLQGNIQEVSLLKDNVRQDEIIHQITKAVTVCRSHPKFVSTDVLIEAERILLIANLKKDINTDELKKLDYEDIDQALTSGSVVIQNLEFASKPKNLLPKNCRWFYFCVIRHGSTINTTKTLMLQNQVLNFPEKIVFEDLPSDFQIYVDIYGFMLKNKNLKKNKGCNHMKTIPFSNMKDMRSNFVLCGSTVIKPIHSRKTIFNLTKVPSHASIMDVLKMNIETTFTIHVKEAGFLTIGLDFKGHPIWNRRWCSLNGSILRYWNYPNDEEHCPPLGELDLLNCASHEVQMAEKDICPIPQTLFIHINSVENGKSLSRRYFLAADNKAEFERWQKSINSVLGYLRKWNDLDCYLDN